MELTTVREEVEARLAEAPPALGERPPKHLLTRTQERIWADEEKRRTEQGKGAERLKAAMERYEPISIPRYELPSNQRWDSGLRPSQWPSGDAEHTCFFGQHFTRGDRLVAPLCLGIFAALAIWVISALFSSELWWEAFVAVGLGTLTGIAWSIPQTKEGCRWYNGLMPAGALAAYQEAKQSRLFDTIQVYSPREEDFRFEPLRTRTDPLLIGEVAGYHFLIVYWNLAEDIAFVSAKEAAATGQEAAETATIE